MQEFFYHSGPRLYSAREGYFNEFNLLKRDCRELPVSGCKSYDIHTVYERLKFALSECFYSSMKLLLEVCVSLRQARSTIQLSLS